MFSKWHPHHFSFASLCISERYAEERCTRQTLISCKHQWEHRISSIWDGNLSMAKASKHVSDSHIYRLNVQGKRKLLMKHITSHYNYEAWRWPRMEKLNSKCKYPAVHFCSFSPDLRKICCVSRQCTTKRFRFLNFILCTLHLNVITSLNHLLMSDSAPLTFVTQLLNKLSRCYSLLKEELSLFSCW